MNDEQLDRSLRSIGKECFVKYFDEFSNANFSREDLIDLLMSREKYKESGCKTRISQSRRIINSGRANDALDMIVNSARLPDTVRDQARALQST